MEAEREAKSDQNRLKILSKFEVDFGCDFLSIWATGPGGSAACAEPVKPDPVRSGGHVYWDAGPPIIDVKLKINCDN